MNALRGLFILTAGTLVAYAMKLAKDSSVEKRKEETRQKELEIRQEEERYECRKAENEAEMARKKELYSAMSPEGIAQLEIEKEKTKQTLAQSQEKIKEYKDIVQREIYDKIKEDILLDIDARVKDLQKSQIKSRNISDGISIQLG